MSSNSQKTNRSLIKKFFSALSSRSKPVIASFLVVLTAFAMLYVKSNLNENARLQNELKKKQDRIDEINGIIESKYSQESEALLSLYRELQDADLSYQDILEKYSSLQSDRESMETALEDQQNLIEYLKEIQILQKMMIDAQNNQIEEQQKTIEKTDEAISEIADIIGTNIEPISGESLYGGLDSIEETEEIIVKTFNNPSQVEKYIAILDEKKAEINDKLNHYPDFNPAEGKISYTFGNHFVTVDGKSVTKYHRGLDICNHNGGPIYSAAEGTVTEVHLTDDGTGLGYYVRIDHGNGYVTLYGHLKSACVKVGQSVAKGEKIGMMGETGAATGVHVHFEVYLNGQLQDPINYVDY